MQTPILFVGAPGIGKTATVRAGFDYTEVLLLSSMTEEDIAGLPYRENDKERRTVPKFVERLQARPGSESICLFLDEIDKARREVADTLLTLITHPQDFGLPERVAIRAAANPPEWGGGDGLSQAMLSRFSIVNFNVDLEKWGRWLLAKYKNSELVRQVLRAIRDERVQLLEHNGDGFNFRLSCPRTWDMAIQALIDNEPDQVISGLLTANDASFLLSLRKGRGDADQDLQDISRSVGSKAVKNILRI